MRAASMLAGVLLATGPMGQGVAQSAAGSVGNTSPALEACLQALPGSNALESVPCIEAERRVQEERLAKALQAASEAALPERRAEIHTVQALWAEYMMRNCALILTNPMGGSIRPLAEAQCRLRAVRNRAAELEDPEGWGVD